MVIDDSVISPDSSIRNRQPGQTDQSGLSERCMQECFDQRRQSASTRVESLGYPQSLDFSAPLLRQDTVQLNDSNPKKLGDKRDRGILEVGESSKLFENLFLASRFQDQPAERQKFDTQPSEKRTQAQVQGFDYFRTSTQGQGFDYFQIGDSQKRSTQSQEFQLSKIDRRRDLPDATVYVPAGFDASKPINVIIYNHGRDNTANGALKAKQLKEQMDGAPPNSMLIIPAWQQTEGADNNTVDKKFRSHFMDMVSHAVKQKGKTLDDIGSLQIVSHSGGYVPSNIELAALKETPLYDRITSVANLDSHYERLPRVDEWIRYNINKGRFASGQASYLNVFNTDGDPKQVSMGQVSDVADWAGDPKLVGRGFSSRRHSPDREAVKYPIAFIEVRTGHGEIPNKYFRTALARTPRPRQER